MGSATKDGDQELPLNRAKNKVRVRKMWCFRVTSDTLCEHNSFLEAGLPEEQICQPLGEPASMLS